MLVRSKDKNDNNDCGATDSRGPADEGQCNGHVPVCPLNGPQEEALCAQLAN